MLAALEGALGIRLRFVDELPQDLVHAARGAVPPAGDVTEFQFENARYRCCRLFSHASTILVLGPYRRPGDPPCDCATVDAAAEERLHATLQSARRAIEQVMEIRADRLELLSQFELITDAVIAISSELSLDLVLRRIVDLAREIVGARYAALGIPDTHGGLASFLTSGMGEEEIEKIGDLPRGKGILGLLLREPKSIRLTDLSTHPASVGFPPNHPPMKSFLGVPIMARGRVLGNLYLTEKRFGADFTGEDVRLVEILARHAAVAIEHAELYGRIESARNRLQLIVDQLPEAVLVVGRDPEQVLVANRQASALLGWEIKTPISLEQFFERNPRFHADGSRISAEDLHMARALRRGEVISREELYLTRPDGTRLALLVNTAPLWNDEGDRVTNAVVVFQDITQIKDAEQLKDEFLSLVSHELRTPLTTIHGGAHPLLHDSEQLDRETRDEMLSDILGESRRLASLVENMVQLANIRAGRFTMEFEPIMVRSLVARAVAASTSRDPERPLAIHVEPALVALGDAGRLEQVLQNLVSNALKYSSAGSPIEIDASRVGSMVAISVRDHGPGIDEETLPILFERFQRGERALKSGAAGMGLGLYLSKHLVEAHGGTITIEVAPGGGTLARFTAPALEDDR
jgi:PAS domain S-box-containing protein